jgi:D-alanyl-D-alanine carboxypeptidase
MFVDQAISKPTNQPTNTSIKENLSLRFSYRNNQNKLTMREHINVDDDSSLYKYVNTSVPLNDTTYIPAILVPINSPYVIQRSRWMELRPEANAALNELAQAFYETFDKKLYLVSAYRSYKFQKQLIDQWCPPSRCARPGTSEHQLGLAIDIHVWSDWRQTNSMSNKDSVYYRRLEQNAHKFGWHNTFQKWIHIDGQMEEWRHWRYIGKHFAKKLWEQDLTFAEYYNQVKK